MSYFEKIQIMAEVSPGIYRTIEGDEITRAVPTLDYEHHEIHEGDHFVYHDQVELGSNGTQDYLITVPDMYGLKFENSKKWAHLTFTVSGSAITEYQIYEDTDKTGTTAQTAINNNRNSTNTPLVTIKKGTSGGTTDGTKLPLGMKSGSAQGSSRTGMESSRSSEIILKNNTKYIIRITSGTAANLCNIQLSWYEHTNMVVND